MVDGESEPVRAWFVNEERDRCPKLCRIGIYHATVDELRDHFRLKFLLIRGIITQPLGNSNRICDIVDFQQTELGGWE